MHENAFGWAKRALPPAQEAAGEAHRDGRDRHQQHRTAGDTITRPHPDPETAPEVASSTKVTCGSPALDLLALVEAIAAMDSGAVLLEYKITPPRLKVLHGILRDETAERIAATLGVKPSTVKTHIQDMRKRFNVGSRTGIATVFLGRLLLDKQAEIDRLKAELEAVRGEKQKEAVG